MTKFKCISQNDETDCGPACLAAIFRKYGLKVSIPKIRDIAGTDRQGTTTPKKHFTDVIFCERKEWIGIEERSSA